MVLLGVLYSLGLSNRGTETALSLFGHSVDHVSRWRDIQRLGKAVRKPLPSNSATVMGVDETWLKVRGKSRPLGVVIDVGGRMLSVELTGRRFDYREWFETLVRELEVQLVVTDDSRDYSTGIDDAGLSRQQCPVHMKRTLGRARRRLTKVKRDRYDELLNQIAETVADLPPDGADRLLRWSTDIQLPSELRWLAVHLLERWRQMTVHQTRPEVPMSTNYLEGKFGRIKPRYRTTRGLKTDTGAITFIAVVCDIVA